jgi:hypothetical protein
LSTVKDNHFWENVVFSDEKRFKSSPDGKVRVYRPRKQRCNTNHVFKANPNKRFSVNIWDWISAQSHGVLLNVEEGLTSNVYIRILEDVMHGSGVDWQRFCKNGE